MLVPLTNPCVKSIKLVLTESSNEYTSYLTVTFLAFPFETFHLFFVLKIDSLTKCDCPNE